MERRKGGKVHIPNEDKQCTIGDWCDLLTISTVSICILTYIRARVRGHGRYARACILDTCVHTCVRRTRTDDQCAFYARSTAEEEERKRVKRNAGRPRRKQIGFHGSGLTSASAFIWITAKQGPSLFSFRRTFLRFFTA